MTEPEVYGIIPDIIGMSGPECVFSDERMTLT